MTDIPISRGGTTVTVEAVEDAGGNLLVGRDIGKPNTTVHETNLEDPRFGDHTSSQSLYTVIGKLTGPNAYSDAKTLAESIVKPRLANDSPLTLDLSNLPSRGTVDVAQTNANSLELTYPAGMTDYVDVSFTAQQVNDVDGGSSTAQSYGSPDAGSGAKLTDGTDSVTVTDGLSVTRTVGRPGMKVTPRATTFPDVDDLAKSSNDVFQLSGELTASGASDSSTLEDIVKQRLGTGALELHFQGTEYGLDKYPVIPDGSQALRTVFQSAEEGIVAVPTLKLRVVTET